MSLLAATRRAPILRSRTALQSRSIHPSSPARAGDHHHQAEDTHLPFNQPGKHTSKAAFATKMIAILGFGFSIPFVAAEYQMKKAGATE